MGSFTVNFYQLDKRVNSTKRPSGTGTSFSVDLKAPCSIYAPVFVLDGAADNFNYAKWGSKYYFVTDVVRSAESRTFVEYHCQLDDLATLKNEIKATSAFVAYSSNNNNAYCLDPRIPTSTQVLAEMGGSLSIASLLDGNGTYIVGCVGTNGITYYPLTPAQLMTLAGAITAATSSDIDNAFINKFGNLIDCVQSVTWVPLAQTGTAETVYLGSYNTGITAPKKDPRGWVLIPDASYTINYVYDGLTRRKSTERITVYLPGYGPVELEPSAIAYETALWMDATIDVMGNLCYCLRVKHNGSIIWQSTFNTRIGVDMPFGKAIATLASEAAQLISASDVSVTRSFGGWAQSHPKIGKIVSFAFGLGEDMGSNYEVPQFISELTKTGQNAITIGGYSGGAGVRALLEHPDMKIVVTAFAFCETQDNMNDLYGRPVNRVLSLNNCTGFVQTVNASVAGNWPANILNEVSAQLNSGIYIE